MERVTELSIFYEDRLIRISIISCEYLTLKPPSWMKLISLGSYGVVSCGCAILTLIMCIIDCLVIDR